MINSKQKEFCANNISSIVILKLEDLFPTKTKSELIFEFISSKTYKDLFDFKLDYWMEGPDSILSTYLKEIKNNF